MLMVQWNKEDFSFSSVEARRKKKISVCQGTLKEALKIDTDASLLAFLLLSRRPADESLLVYDRVTQLCELFLSHLNLLEQVFIQLCASQQTKYFSLHEHRSCLSVLALPPDFICLNAIQHSCSDSSTSQGDPDSAWLKGQVIQHSTSTVFERFHCCFRVVDSDQRLNSCISSKSELDTTDFSIVHVYSGYYLLQEQ